jgi:hypothetical protein
MLEVFLVIRATLVWTSASTWEAIFNEADDEFHVKVAESLEEACRLLEVGLNTLRTWTERNSSGSGNE